MDVVSFVAKRPCCRNQAPQSQLFSFNLCSMFLHSYLLYYCQRYNSTRSHRRAASILFPTCWVGLMLSISKGCNEFARAKSVHSKRKPNHPNKVSKSASDCCERTEYAVANAILGWSQSSIRHKQTRLLRKRYYSLVQIIAMFTKLC